MYLSRIVIKKAFTGDIYSVHKALWDLFPNEPDAQRDFLFRVEKKDRFGTTLLLQSERSPLSAGTDAIEVKIIKKMSVALERDQDVRFILVGNPVRTIVDCKGRLDQKRNKPKRCRVPLLRYEEQMAWLKRKLSGIAEIGSTDVQNLPPFFIKKEKEMQPGKIQPVAYEGKLKVKEPMLLNDLIKQGVGPAKAFGCGLISIAPV